MLKKFAVAAALVLGASSSFAAPASSGPAPTLFYGGIDVGVTKIDELDGNKGGLGGFVGYGFNQNVAVELGYRQLGKFDVMGVDVKLKQTHVSVVGSLPLNPQLSLYGRLGYNNINVSGSGYGVKAEADTDGVLYGIGLNYRFAPDILSRVEVQKPTSDSTNLHFGLVFEF